MYTLIYLSLLVFLIHGTHADKLHPRVFDGQEVGFNRKYLVELLISYQQNENLYYSACSGSILSPRWIISAAHCFFIDFKQLEVRKQNSGTIGYVKKAQITIHPEYKNDSPIILEILEKDVALLKTVKNMKLDKLTQPIPMAQRRPKVGDAVIIAGYGQAEDGAIVPREGATVVTRCYPPTTTLICTFSTVRAGDGDSGGALVFKGRLAGVTSASCENVTIDQNCETVYVDVAHHLKWIKEVMLK